jgi:hypothetical protein
MLQGFALWFLHTENLQADTVKNYLNSLSHIQKMHGFPGILVANSPIIPNLLQGAKNARRTVETPKIIDPIMFDRLKGQ